MKTPLMLFLIPLAGYGTIVTTTKDEDNQILGGGTGISLREAVMYSTPGSTITFAPALSGKTIRLTLREIPISKSLTLDASTLPARITIDGDIKGDGKTPDDTRIFRVTSGIIVLDSLVLANGYSSFGGAIELSSASNTHLTVRHCTFSGNSAISHGGAVSHNTTTGGANPTLIITDSAFFGNSAATRGGAISVQGQLFMENTTLSGNSSGSGGAIYLQNGTATVETSTLSENAASAEGGALYVAAGAFVSRSSTYAGNTAGTTGGAIGARDGILTFRQCTISSNRAVGPGGGTGKTGATLVFADTIVAGNFADSPTTANTYSTFTATTSFLGADPLLAPLGDYGGPTHTMPPLPQRTSPVEVGAASPSARTVDQRGLPVPAGKASIGAAQYQGTPDLTRFWALDFDGDDSPYGTEQALGTDPLVADPAHSRNITSPVINTSGHPVLTFGIDSAAAYGTRWILSRSTDLRTFTEIYRYNGGRDTALPGVTFTRTATGVTITDTTPPPGGATFYRFEAKF